PTDVFDYTIQDTDGDTSSTTLTIEIKRARAEALLTALRQADERAALERAVVPRRKPEPEVQDQPEEATPETEAFTPASVEPEDAAAPAAPDQLAALPGQPEATDAALAESGEQASLAAVERLLRARRADLRKGLQAYLDALLPSDKMPVASERVPLPHDPAVVTNELKAACYFLDATQVGACQREDGISDGNFAIVLLVEYGRTPETENLASDWVNGTAHRCSTLRGAEIALVISGYIKQLGFTASVHAQGVSDLDLGELARCAGLVERNGSGNVAPFIGERFAIAAVVTSLLLQVDRPLVPGATSPSLRSRFKYWLGMGAGTSGMERNAQRRRASHLGQYPMEKIRRRDTPTTLIFDDEVPRIPQRASFFRRAGELKSAGAATPSRVNTSKSCCTNWACTCRYA
ncbi:MAG: hypothetical protein IH897_05050, partial [Planctomycetes bacterium]|nr:hypothetical protein [Planctomycetota bacterium]